MAASQPLLTFSAPTSPPQLHPATLTYLESAFNPTSDIVIIAAVGTHGTGKSTWLNTISLSFDRELASDPFLPSTRTEHGLYVYPRPITLSSTPNSPQILLCEVNCDTSDTQMGGIGMFSAILMASWVCIHTDNEEKSKDLVRNLGKFTDFMQFQRSEVAIFAQNFEEIESFRGIVDFPCRFFSKGQKNSKFLQNRLTNSLFGSIFHQKCLQFVSFSLKFPKKKPGFDRNLRIFDLRELISKITEIFPENDILNAYFDLEKSNFEAILSQIYQKNKRNLVYFLSNPLENHSNSGEIVENIWEKVLKDLKNAGICIDLLRNLRINLELYKEELNEVAKKTILEGNRGEMKSIESHLTIKERLSDLESAKQSIKPLKKDGTPDMRYKVNRDSSSLSSSSVSSSLFNSKNR